MDNGPSPEGNIEGGEETNQGEGGSIDKLSHADEVLFNLLYPLAVQVCFYVFFFFDCTNGFVLLFTNGPYGI